MCVRVNAWGSIAVSFIIIVSLIISGVSCQPVTRPAPPPAAEPAPAATPIPQVTAPTPAAMPVPPGEGPLKKAIIVDHQCVDISLIPPSYIDQARSSLKIWYGHTSHGNQITTGMRNLQSKYGNTYNFNAGGSGGALSYQEVSADLGQKGDLRWRDTTRTQLNQVDNEKNVVIWSWCGGVSATAKGGVDIYLNAMNQLEIDYPEVRFIYMTGHLDGTGESGNLNTRNEQIRNYCKSNNKILFDFADIESYDPGGNYFLDRNANDNCDYNGGNWAQEWCAKYPSSDFCRTCQCAHSQALNCNLKGRALWWMLARIAGWNGQ